MSTQKSLEKLDSETITSPQPLKEIKYSGQCFGKECFTMQTKDAVVGFCTKTSAFIMVDLAKREMLCDYKQTRYHPTNPANTKQATKPKVKKRV